MYRRDNVGVKMTLFNEQSQKMALTKAAFSGVARRVGERGAASLSGTMNQTNQRRLCQLAQPVKTMLRLLGGVSRYVVLSTFNVSDKNAQCDQEGHWASGEFMCIET